MKIESSSEETTPGEKLDEAIKATPNLNTPVFPSMEEQEEHWKRKEFESLDNKQLLRVLDAFSTFLGELNNAIGKLRQEFEIISKP